MVATGRKTGRARRPDLRCLFVPVSLLLFRSAHGAEEWRSLAPLATPRQEVAVAEAGGKIYVIGGILADRRATNIVERYDPALDRWESVPPLPEPLHHIGATYLDGVLYSIGGLNDGFDGVRSCFAYADGDGEWRRIAPLPTARGAMGVAALDGRIYAAGGQRSDGTVAEFAAFSPGPQGGSWETLAPMPTARNHLAAGASGGLFYAISGRRGGALRPEVECYNPNTGDWSPRSPIPTPRGGIALATLGARFYVFGGEGNRADPSGVFSETEMYDTLLDRWFERRSMSIPRHGIGAAPLGGAILIPGGAEVEGFGVTDANTEYVPPSEDLAPRTFVRGDANGDAAIDLTDAISILFRLFLDGPGPVCPDAADTNDDGRINIADPVHLLEHLFREGPPPPPPGPEPAPDPTTDGLGC